MELKIQVDLNIAHECACSRIFFKAGVKSRLVIELLQTRCELDESITIQKRGQKTTIHKINNEDLTTNFIRLKEATN